MQTVPMSSGTFWRGAFDITVFSLATMSAAVFYLASQYELSRDWRSVIKYLPMLMALGVGLCVSNTKAILEALVGKKSEFVRTPKYGGQAAPPARAGAKRKRSLVPYVEFVFGLYMTACIVVSVISLRAAMTTPFLVMFAFGFFYVSLMTFQAQRQRSVAAKPVEAPVEVDP
jgi:hypothetical protein